MSFRDKVETVDVTCLKEFGIPATLNHQAGGASDIVGIVQNPAMAEDYVPGSSQGVSVVRFFVRFVDITPVPIKGDTVTLGGVTYDIGKPPEVDREGGAVLILRRNA